MNETHDGMCGAHLANNKIKWLLRLLWLLLPVFVGRRQVVRPRMPRVPKFSSLKRVPVEDL